jgi:hypothetical protein
VEDKKGLTTGYACNSNAKREMILFGNKLDKVLKKRYARFRIGFRERSRNGGTGFGPRLIFMSKNSLLAGSPRPDKIALGSGWKEEDFVLGAYGQCKDNSCFLLLMNGSNKKL